MALPRRDANRWRILAQKLWMLSDELNQTAQYIRYANKPSDLILPITQLIQMAHRLNLFKDKWLLQWLKSRSEGLRGWPKLWERYL